MNGIPGTGKQYTALAQIGVVLWGNKCILGYLTLTASANFILEPKYQLQWVHQVSKPIQYRSHGSIASGFVRCCNSTQVNNAESQRRPHMLGLLHLSLSLHLSQYSSPCSHLIREQTMRRRPTADGEEEDGREKGNCRWGEE